jgi:membrane-bound ClpP family serine protease
MNSMKGARGIALDHLDPVGHIEIRGERWKAEVVENGQLIKRGEVIRVCGIRGLTLLVQPDSQQGEV